MSVQFFTAAALTRAESAPRPPAKVSATRCAHCRRDLPTGEGRNVEFIGTLGPECVKRYAPLVAALTHAHGLEALEEDEGTVRLGHYVVMSLRRAGVAVRVVDVRPGVKALEIVGLSRKPAAVVTSWEQMRAEFEHRLRLAQAEREGGAVRPCACTDGDRVQPLSTCTSCNGTGRVA